MGSLLLLQTGDSLRLQTADRLLLQDGSAAAAVVIPWMIRMWLAV